MTRLAPAAERDALIPLSHAGRANRLNRRFLVSEAAARWSALTGARPFYSAVEPVDPQWRARRAATLDQTRVETWLAMLIPLIADDGDRARSLFRSVLRPLAEMLGGIAADVEDAANRTLWRS